MFSCASNQAADLESNTTIALLEELQDKVLALTPTNAKQRWLQPQALELIGTMMAARSQLGAGGKRERNPLPLLLLVMFWFIIIFASFGLFGATQYDSDCHDFPLRGWDRHRNPDDDGTADAFWGPDPHL